MSKKILVKICNRRGKEFNPDSRPRQSKVCSDICAKDRTSQEVRICIVCGKPIKAGTPKQVQTCSRECGYEKRRQKTLGKVRNCSVCGEHIDNEKRGRRATTCSDDCRGRAIGNKSTKTYTCEACGRKFERSVKARTCSKDCYEKIRYLANNRRQYKVCEVCQLTFSSTSLTNMICKKCQREQSQKRLQQQRALPTIPCQVCQGNYQQITKPHLKQHGLTVAMYRAKFPEAPLSSSLVRANKKNNCNKLNQKLKDKKAPLIKQLTNEFNRLQPVCHQCQLPLTLTKYLSICLKGNSSEAWHRLPRFCSLSCRGKYSMTDRDRAPCVFNKKRSRGEKALAEALRTNFPTLNIIENDRTIIGPLEIDIWIPQLRLAIEYNGSHHYSAVFGEERFKETLLTDARKKIKLSEMGIILEIVDGRSKNSVERTQGVVHLIHSMVLAKGLL